MSKYHQIRWTEQDTKEINRVVKNFNAKVSRLAKKNPKLANVLPEKVSTKELKLMVNTRQDLKRELNSLKRFSKKGSEQIVVVPNTEYELKITKWQQTEMNRRVGIINRRRKQRLEELESLQMTYKGKDLGYTRGQLGMGKAEEVSLSPMNAFYRTMGYTDLKKKWTSILWQSQSDYLTIRDYMVRDNYIVGLLENYNENDIKDVVDSIRNMDINDFLKIFQQEGGTFEYVYPGSEQEQKYIDYLKTTWGVKNKDFNSELIKANDVLNR